MAFDGVEQTLNKAIGWASELPEAYRYANDKVRRGLNQAVFTRLMVFEDGVTAYEYTEGMEVFLERNPKVVPMPEQFKNSDLQDEKPSRFSFGNLQNYIGSAFAQGLDVIHLVEVIRGLSNPLHPGQKLIIEWKTREESHNGPSNGKISLSEYAPEQRQTRLDPQQINNLVIAYQSGNTIKQLAAQFQIHHTTASKILERREIPKRYRPLAPEQIETAIKAYRAGSSSKMIGDLLGVNASTIWRTLRREGVNMRDSQGREI